MSPRFELIIVTAVAAAVCFGPRWLPVPLHVIVAQEQGRRAPDPTVVEGVFTRLDAELGPMDRVDTRPQDLGSAGEQLASWPRTLVIVWPGTNSVLTTSMRAS